jgi:DNA-binding MurR/RpiR family transcriptional regulator
MERMFQVYHARERTDRISAPTYTAPVDAADRIARQGASLTRAERRVAEVVLERPQLVAFGTVAELAATAEAGAATVVRLAAKLGFDGFSALQASVQHDLANQLRPAAERIREPPGDDLVSRHLQLEQANVHASVGGLDRAALDDVIAHLADPAARVFVIAGDSTRGVAQQLVLDLGALRDDVHVLDGNDIAVRRQLALLRAGDVVVTVDVRRYERWVVDAAEAAAAAGAWSVAVTDSVLSPLSAVAQRTLVIAAAGAGPFDSHVGTLAVFNVLATAVADRLRSAATRRLDRLESSWQQSLTDG